MKETFEKELRERIVEINNEHEKMFKEPLLDEKISAEIDSMEVILDDLMLVKDFFIEEWRQDFKDDKYTLNYYNNLEEKLEEIFASVLTFNK